MADCIMDPLLSIVRVQVELVQHVREIRGTQREAE